MLTLATSEILTTEEAREEARRALARAAMGGDPQRVKAERRAEMTVKELCELYMEEGTATKKETTLQIDRIRIKRHINPRIGNMKVTDVARADIQRLMIDVGNGNIRKDATPHTRGGKGAAGVSIAGRMAAASISRTSHRSSAFIRARSTTRDPIVLW
jgi:hypothetical protein